MVEVILYIQVLALMIHFMVGMLMIYSMQMVETTLIMVEMLRLMEVELLLEVLRVVMIQ
jgi:hypothetical protein